MTQPNLFWDNLAIQSYKTLIKKNPNNAKIHNNLGLAYLRVGQTARAIRAFRKATRIDSDYAEAYYHLGTTYQKCGSINQARRSFIKYNKAIGEETSFVVNDLLEELKT